MDSVQGSIYKESTIVTSIQRLKFIEISTLKLKYLYIFHYRLTTQSLMKFHLRFGKFYLKSHELIGVT
jgi:hypothetical protein